MLTHADFNFLKEVKKQKKYTLQPVQAQLATLDEAQKKNAAALTKESIKLATTLLAAPVAVTSAADKQTDNKKEVSKLDEVKNDIRKITKQITDKKIEIQKLEKEIKTFCATRKKDIFLYAESLAVLGDDKAIAELLFEQGKKNDATLLNKLITRIARGYVIGDLPEKADEYYEKRKLDAKLANTPSNKELLKEMASAIAEGHATQLSHEDVKYYREDCAFSMNVEPHWRGCPADVHSIANGYYLVDYSVKPTAPHDMREACIARNGMLTQTQFSIIQRLLNPKNEKHAAAIIAECADDTFTLAEAHAAKGDSKTAEGFLQPYPNGSAARNEASIRIIRGYVIGGFFEEKIKRLHQTQATAAGKLTATFEERELFRRTVNSIAEALAIRSDHLQTEKYWKIFAADIRFIANGYYLAGYFSDKKTALLTLSKINNPSFRYAIAMTLHQNYLLQFNPLMLLPEANRIHVTELPYPLFKKYVKSDTQEFLKFFVYSGIPIDGNFIVLSLVLSYWSPATDSHHASAIVSMVKGQFREGVYRDVDFNQALLEDFGYETPIKSELEECEEEMKLECARTNISESFMGFYNNVGTLFSRSIANKAYMVAEAAKEAKSFEAIEKAIKLVKGSDNTEDFTAVIEKNMRFLNSLSPAKK